MWSYYENEISWNFYSQCLIKNWNKLPIKVKEYKKLDILRGNMNNLKVQPSGTEMEATTWG